jgi:hypothetical protein
LPASWCRLVSVCFVSLWCSRRVFAEGAGSRQSDLARGW